MSMDNDADWAKLTPENANFMEDWEKRMFEREERQKLAVEAARQRRDRIVGALRRFAKTDEGKDFLTYLRDVLCEHDKYGFPRDERSACFWMGRRFVWGEVARLLGDGEKNTEE